MPDPQQSRYVPPHLRSRPASSSSSSTSHAAPATSQRGYDRRSTPSRPIWGPGPGPGPAGRSSYANDSAGPSQASYSGVAEGSRTPGRNAQSAPTRPGQSYGASRGVGAGAGGGGGGGGGSPSLYVFGDSFVGPMKLLSDDCASVRTFKGASAKGLDNPNSMKQVSRDLLPELQRLLAPPPYVYQPSNGRWVLLIFGNVDLQINYLWQLQHKRISSLSFRPPSGFSEVDNEESTDLRVSSDTAGTETAGTAETEFDVEPEPETGPAVLASATETTLRGPALGPELFVSTVLRAYTNFLEREIINGPVGQRLRESAEARRQALEASVAGAAGPGTSVKPAGGPRKRLPPRGKVLVAGALPPLVEDEVLSRIPEKYVERLEEEHEKAHRAMGHPASVSTSASAPATASGTAFVPAGSGSRTPWAKGDNPRSGTGNGETAETAPIEVGLATISLSDRPVTPRSLSSSSSKESSLFDNNLNNSALSSGTEPSAPALAHPAPRSGSGSTSSPSAKPSSSTGTASTSKTPVSTLLEHDPPLCTLPVRVRMTNLFNSGLSLFCEKYPDILSFVDITPRMRAHDDSSGWTSSSGQESGEVDRSTWACPVDPTNVHPLWEPTLPLWLEALKEVGVPTDGFGISKDAEETFRAYEKDKRRRTGLDDEAGEAEGERIKLRDE